MQQYGHTVHVVTPSKYGPFLEMLKSVKCPYSLIDIRLETYPKKKNIIKNLYDFFLIWKTNRKAKILLKEAIINYKPDIVHTNVGPFSLGAQICNELNIPHVWHQREYTNLYPDYNFIPNFGQFLKYLNFDTNHNICITRGVYKHINAKEGRDIVIYDGVIDGDFSTTVEKERDNVVLYVGRIHEGKGTLDVIDAFSKFHKTNPNYILKLIGGFSKDDSYYQRCRKIVLDQGLDHKIFFEGESNNVNKYLRHSKMIIIPSLFEGFGFVMVEAMQNKCPVIARNTTGLREQFENGLKYSGFDIAYLFDDNNDIVTAMQKIISNNNEQMVESAYNTVTHMYTTERNARQIEKYYYNILKG